MPNKTKIFPGTAPQWRGSFARLAAGFSRALDAAEGNSADHALRTCILGMKLGRHIGLNPQQLNDLFYALLFKDLGTSNDMSCPLPLRGAAGLEAGYAWCHGLSGLPRRRAMATLRTLFLANLSVRGVKALLHRMSGQNEAMQPAIGKRRNLAYERARTLGFSSGTADTIAHIDARWDGKGTPAVRSFAIPVTAQIVKLAQTLDMLQHLYGGQCALETVYARCKGWFDPGLIAAAMLLFQKNEGWSDLKRTDLLEYAGTLLPGMLDEPAWDARADRLCRIFGEIIDSRSQHTAGHSAAVAQIAERIAGVLGLPMKDIRTLRRAALLHDIGNLTISPALLDKSETLTNEETRILREAPAKTFEFLSRIPGFAEIAAAAGSHRERLDGSGAPVGLEEDSIGLLARILAVADVTEALAATRSYRPRLSYQELCRVMDEMTPHQLDEVCVKALRSPAVMALVA